MYAELTILALFVFVYSAIAGGVERTPVTGPIVFTAFGLALGPVGLGWLQLDIDQEGLRTLAELTLALVLFTDAANANLSVLGKSWRIPERLLGIGLPLTIVLGFVVGVLLFPELTWFEIAILATMLAPTDAALGKAVVTNASVPADLREGLNVESGLNDGICVPILLALLALATGVEQYWLGFSLEYFAEAIGIGVAVGRRGHSDRYLALASRHPSRLDHRDLAAAPRGGARIFLLRLGPISWRQRLHRRLRGRPPVRRHGAAG